MSGCPDQTLPPEQVRSIWNDLDRRHDRGEAYLDERGLYVAALLDAGVVRFFQSGAPAIVLRHLAIGAAAVNVVRRNLPADVAAGRPKVHGLRGAPTSGCLLGSLDEIGTERRDAVLVEGVIDSLTALCAWPLSVIAGAHGAGRMAELGAEVAGRCASAGTRLLIVHDDDRTGVRAAAEALRNAIAAGLVLGETVILVDLEGAHDLNAAWRTGWFPS